MLTRLDVNISADIRSQQRDTPRGANRLSFGEIGMARGRNRAHGGTGEAGAGFFFKRTFPIWGNSFGG